MSSSTSQQPERASAVAKLLDRARSINIRPDPEDAPAVSAATVPTQAATPIREEPAAAVEPPTPARESVRPAPAAETKRDARSRRKPETGRTLNRTFDIVTGPATRALTVRIPDEMHARLVLVATSNRLGRTGDASTLNELIAEGIEHVLQRYDAA